jgi:hypothetical protein
MLVELLAYEGFILQQLRPKIVAWICKEKKTLASGIIFLRRSFMTKKTRSADTEHQQQHDLPEDHLPGESNSLTSNDDEDDEDLSSSEDDEDEEEGLGDGKMGRPSDDPFSK